MKSLKWVGVMGVLTTSLIGCGGGGGGTSNDAGTTPESSQTVTGTAAVGAAISKGVLELKCQNTSSLIQSTTAMDGTFSVALDKEKLPCLLRVTSSDGQTILHGVAVGDTLAVVANVTPLTDLILSTTVKEGAASYFATSNNADIKSLNVTTLDAAGEVVKQGLSDLVDVGETNPRTQKFVVGDSFDKKLDAFGAVLKNRKMALNDITSALIAKPPEGKTQVEYVRGKLTETRPTSEAEKIRVAHEKFWQGFYEWTSAVVYDGNDNRSTTHGYKSISQSGTQASVNVFERNADKFVLKNITDYVSYPSEFHLTAKGWEEPRIDDFFSKSDLTPDARGTILMLKSKSDASIGRVLISDLSENNISNQATSGAIDPAYTDNQKGVFAEGSLAYSAWLEFIDDFFLGGPSKQDKKTYSNLSAFREAYKDRPFCTGITGYDKEYGIQFDLPQGRAHLYGADYNCNVLKGAASIEVNVEEVTVDGQAAVKISGSKLPPKTTQFGTIMGGYDSAQTEKDFRYATDRYNVYIWLAQDGSPRRGYKILSGASVLFKPGAGPYLNKVALESLLKTISYPALGN